MKHWKPIIVTLAAIVMATLVIAHTPHLNGPSYWTWPWRDRASLPAIRWYAAMLLAALPIIIAWFLPTQLRIHRVLVIALLMLGVFGMKLTSVLVLTNPPSFSVLSAIVRSPSATSYYVDAAALAQADNWLAVYPEFLPLANLHTQSKPPGAVAYYRAFIRAMGYGDTSAIAAGIVLGALASLSIPATYLLVKTLTADSESGFAAAILLALCPGFILIFPTGDTAYAVLTCAILVSWHFAITRSDWRWAAALGIALALTTFITYNLLVLGAFMLAWGFVIAQRDWRRLLKPAAIAIGTFLLAYVIFWLVTGFDPVATFRAALMQQSRLLAQHKEQRPYPKTTWFDLADFALGAGWIVLLPAAWGALKGSAVQRKLNLIALALPVLVAILGVLQSETARVWIFMLPLLLLPAGMELARWPRGARAICFASMLLIMLVIGHNMVFILP